MPNAPDPCAPPVLLATSFRIPHAGGASTHIETLAAALRARGRLAGLVTPRALHRRSPGWWVLRAVRRDAAYARSLDLACDDLARGLDRAFARGAPAVVHAHDPLAAFAAARVRRPGVPVVQTVHGPWSREDATMHRRPGARRLVRMQAIEREAFARTDVVIAVDRGQAEVTVRDFGVDPRRIAVVPNAVDVDGLPTAAPERGAPFLLVPRRLVPKNGVDVAIRAWALVSARGERLVVAGDGPLRGQLEALARALGVADRIRFLGELERPRLLPLLARAAAVLVPSVPVNGVVEATSLAVLEAMGSGVPVVGSRLGGIAEIAAGDCALLVPPGDSAALAEAIERLRRMPAGERGALVERARARVRTEYGVEAWMHQVDAAYGAALGGEPLRAPMRLGG